MLEVVPAALERSERLLGGLASLLDRPDAPFRDVDAERSAVHSRANLSADGASIISVAVKRL